MKTHTSNFKNNLIKFGRELDSKITYTQNGTVIELGSEELNSVTPHYEGGILKSVMRQLDIDSNVEIPLETILTYQFGVKVGNGYEYINYGNYIVYKVEKQEDTDSWKITCYDKMLYAMKDYESLEITYPITVRNYINALCAKLGLTFKNASETFANYDKQIPKELYLDDDGNSIGYTYRDVLDELAQVTASTICINEVDNQLEIRYINNTNDTIDEEFLKDVNVNFGESYGPINTIVLSRAGADNIYYPATLPSNPKEIKIVDNQIMNGNDRDTFMPDIYNKLNGLEYYINDFSSTGICYYNLCDRYNVKIGDNTYSCVMFNDEVNVTQGLEENVYTEMPEDAETDYKKSDTTDRRINQTTLIVDKQQQQITGLVSTTQNIEKEINPTKDATGTSFYLEDSTNAELVNFEMEGKTTQESEPSPSNPSELVSVGTYNSTTQKYDIKIETQSKNLWDNKDYYTQLTTNNYTIENNGFTFTRGSLTGGGYIAKRITVKEGITYTFSAISNDFNSNFYQIIYRGNVYGTNVASSTNGKVTYTATANEDLFFTFIISSGVQNASVSNIQVEKNSQATEFEPYYYKIYTYSLNQPLRSIGDVKDLLYIKNGMLYVDRKIGSKILNGSESWGTIGNNRYYTPFQDKRGLTSAVPCLLKSDYFMPTNNAGDAVNIGYMTEGYYTTPVINVFFNYNGVNTDLAGFKTWLSTHNVEVQYILASSNTEGLGKIEVPSTYKTTTYIDTVDINEPNMNITYVRDTQISNYVEEHISQIIVNEEGIVAEVNKKVDDEEIIAKLNLAIEDEQGIIEMKGNQVIIDSDYFKLSADGKINSTGGTIGGYKITDNMLYAEIFAPYDYTNDDLTKIYNYMTGRGTLTPEEFEKYDVNKDGKVNSLDYVNVYQFIRHNVTTTNSTKIIMRTGSYMFDNAYVLQDGLGNDIVRITFNGIYYRDTNISNISTYSTDEIAIGTFDGKTVYRKVVQKILDLSSAGQHTFTLGISNMENLIKMDYKINGYYDLVYNNAISAIGIKSDDKSLYIYTNTNWDSALPFTFIIEYTKTN